MKDFIKGVQYYFRRFAGVAIFFWTLTIVWTILIWVPYVTNLFYMIEYWVAEYMIIWLIPILGMLYFLGISFLFAWSVQTRYFMIYQSHWSFGAFKFGLKQVTQRIMDHYMTLLIYALLLFIGYGFYFVLELRLGISGALMVVLFVVIQQVFILAKLWHRAAVYISLRNLQRIRKNGK